MTNGDDREVVELGVVRHLVALVAGSGEPVPAYLRAYLPDHARQAGPDAWQLLAEHPDVLAQLDIDAVTSAAVRTPFGATPMPDPVAAVVGARRSLVAAAPADLPGLRQIALARFGRSREVVAPDDPDAGAAPWRVEVARLDPRQPHVSLRADEDEGVRSLAAFVDADGSLRIVSGGSRGTIDVWDPLSGLLIHSLDAHDGSVRALAVVGTPTGPRLVSAGEDGDVAVWDIARWASVRRVSTGSAVWALVALAADGGPTVIAGCRDGGLHAWDLDLEARVPSIATGSWITALAEMDGRVVVGDDDGRVRSWSPGTTTLDPVAARRTGVRALAVFRVDDQPRILVMTSDERGGLLGPGGSVTEVRGLAARAAAAVRVDGRWVLAVADRADLALVDGSGAIGAQRLTGHTRKIRAVIGLPDAGGSLVLASGAEDGTIRCWVRASMASDPPLTEQQPLGAVSALGAVDGDLVVATAAGRLHVLDRSGQWRTIDSEERRRVDRLRVLYTGADRVLVAGERGVERFVSLEPGSAIDAAPPADARFVARESHVELVQGAPAEVIGRWQLADGIRWLETVTTQQVRTAIAVDESGRVWAVAAGAPEPRLLYAAGRRIEAICVFDGGTGTELALAAGHQVRVMHLSGAQLLERWVSSAHAGDVHALAQVDTIEGPGVVSGDGDGRIVVSVRSTGRVVQTLEIGLPVLSLAAVGSRLAVGTSEGLLVLGVVGLRGATAVDPLA